MLCYYQLIGVHGIKDFYRGLLSIWIEQTLELIKTADWSNRSMPVGQGGGTYRARDPRG